MGLRPLFFGVFFLIFLDFNDFFLSDFFIVVDTFTGDVSDEEDDVSEDDADELEGSSCFVKADAVFFGCPLFLFCPI